MCSSIPHRSFPATAPPAKRQFILAFRSRTTSPGWCIWRARNGFGTHTRPYDDPDKLAEATLDGCMLARPKTKMQTGSARGGSMRRLLTTIRFSPTFWCTLAATAWIGANAVPIAAQVQVKSGAQSADKRNQALTFLPNELWVHTGDSVMWTFPTDEIHTVTFLRPAQNRPPLAPTPCRSCASWSAR